MWLIDMGIYKKVQVVFLVAGYTKNMTEGSKYEERMSQQRYYFSISSN